MDPNEKAEPRRIPANNFLQQTGALGTLPLLTAEQKFIAIQAIAGWDLSIKYSKDRGASPWYVSMRGVDIKDGPMLHSCAGAGRDPESAIHDTWRLITNLPKDQYLVVSQGDKPRRSVRWNGFMWADVDE